MDFLVFFLNVAYMIQGPFLEINFHILLCIPPLAKQMLHSSGGSAHIFATNFSIGGFDIYDRL